MRLFVSVCLTALLLTNSVAAQQTEAELLAQAKGKKSTLEVTVAFGTTTLQLISLGNQEANDVAAKIVNWKPGDRAKLEENNEKFAVKAVSVASAINSIVSAIDAADSILKKYDAGTLDNTATPAQWLTAAITVMDLNTKISVPQMTYGIGELLALWQDNLTIIFQNLP